MTQATLTHRQSGSADKVLEAGWLRLRAYLVCLLVSFGLYVVVYGFVNGLAFLLLCAGVVIALGFSFVASPSRKGSRLLLSAAVTAAAAIALIEPLGGRILSGASVPAAIGESTVWPQVLVLLFAGRILAELSELRFAAFWRSPLDGSGRVETQSMAAAVIFGCCLTLIFYQLVGGVAPAPERLDPWAIAIRAFTGPTAIHAAIILLFFVVLAAIMDAALLSVNDSLVLAAVRRLCREKIEEGGTLSKQEISVLASRRLAHLAHSRALHCIRDAGADESARGPGPGTSLEAFHLASRRLIRALVSFLPLLGFLGTVIGLTAAIGGLPSDLGPQAQGEIDVSASLLGLAIKFETTLLGLAGALLASLLLSLLEKREEELAAECSRLVEAFASED